MILRLPYFAQLSILQQMESFEVLFLGSLSRKAKRLIQKLYKTFMDATVIDMVYKTVEMQKQGEIGKGIVMWTTHESRETLGMRDFSENQWIVLEYNGVKIVCRMTIHPTKCLPLIWCRFEQRKLLPMALQTLICEVFKLSKRTQVKIKFSELSDFPAISEVDNLKEYFSRSDPSDVETFFRVIEVKNSLSLHSDVISPFSSILSVDHLKISYCPLLTKRHLLNFQGISAVFQCAQQLRNKDFIDFITNWMNGMYPNLESMIVKRHSWNRRLFRRQEILSKFETQPWDPSKRSGRFQYPENAAKMNHLMDILDCTQQVDIERNDGMLATIVVENDNFRFFVWKNNFPDPKRNMPVVKLLTSRPSGPTKFYVLGGVLF